MLTAPASHSLYSVFCRFLRKATNLEQFLGHGINPHLGEHQSRRESTSSRKAERSIVAFYQYFNPDPVISSRLYSDLCESLAQTGWNVTVFTSNSMRHHGETALPKKESWRKVQIRRVWRPRHGRLRSRLFSSLWLLATWCLALLKLRILRGQPDVILIGTDPVLSILVARWSKFVSPDTRVAHWCFDLHPEAALAERVISEKTRGYHLLRSWVAKSYQACDLIADLGPCMRQRISKYNPTGKLVTITPWALKEPATLTHHRPADQPVLTKKGTLTLLYSGSMGFAHSFDRIVDLARKSKALGLSIRMTIGARGGQADTMKASMVPGDTNIEFLQFVSEDNLENRLKDADIHLVTLKQDWAGIVVPSKFFAALACGKPVVFAGNRQSTVARMIVDLQLGWVLDTDESVLQAIADLKLLSENPHKLVSLQRHCWEIYRQHFSKDQMLKRWKTELSELVPRAIPHFANQNAGSPRRRA